MLQFNWLDFGIIGIISLSILISIIRGFVREALSLITWLIALWVGLHFSRPLAELLKNTIHSHEIRIVLSFFGLVAVSLIIGAIINYMIGRMLAKTCLKGTDRLLGGAFGLVRGLLVIALLTLLAGMTHFPEKPWWKGSQMVSQFQPMANWLYDLLPIEHNKLRDSIPMEIPELT